jgi:hypothetical protein
MREADEASTKELSNTVRGVVPAPPGVVMLALPTVPRNAWRRQSESRAPGGWGWSAAEGIVEAEVLHLASQQLGSLILREDCYNVVT